MYFRRRMIMKRFLHLLLASALVLSGLTVPTPRANASSGTANTPAAQHNGSLTAKTADDTATQPSASPEASLAPADLHKDLPHLFFTHQTEGGATTNNISTNNYTTYGQTVNSHLEENEDGTFTRIEYTLLHVTVEIYDADFHLVASRTIPKELPVYRGYFHGDGARYLAFSQVNKEESDDVEVFRIVKYDENWNRLGACSLYGANTSQIGMCLSMTERNGMLYVHACHTMYAINSINHQSNISLVIDESTMQVLTQNTQGSYPEYVSHSFNQYIQTDGTNVFTLDQSDGYPCRAIYLQKLDTMMEQRISDIQLMKLDGSYGENTTGVSLGGMELIDDTLYMAGNSIEHTGSDHISDLKRRNLWVSTVSTAMDTTPTMLWLTDYEKKGHLNANTPQIIPAEDGCYVLWEEAYINEKTSGSFFWTETQYTLTKIAKIKKDGTLDGEIHTIYGNLSDCKPIITSDNHMIWYTTAQSAPLFYDLDLQNLDAYEFNGFGDIRKCQAVLETDSYEYTDSPYLAYTVGPTVSAVTYDGYTLTKGKDYSVEYSDNEQDGTGYVCIIGKGFFQDPINPASRVMFKVPFRVHYAPATPTPTLTPTIAPSDTPEPDDTPEPTGTPYQEPGWWSSPKPTQKASATPGTSSTPAPTQKASAKPSTKSSPAPTQKASSAPAKHTQSGNATGELTVPEKISYVKLTNQRGRKLMIYWLPVDECDGYQIQYAVDKKFKKKKKTVSSTAYAYTKTLKKLKKNKTYYVRIRAYRKNGTQKIYGKWSKITKKKITR